MQVITSPRYMSNEFSLRRLPDLNSATNKATSLAPDFQQKKHIINMYKLQSVYRHCVFIIRQQILAKYNRSVGSWTLEHPVCIFKGRPMHRFAIRSSGNGRSLRLCEVPREGRAKDTKQSGKAAAAKAPASHSENSFWTRNLGKTLVLNWSKLVIANMIEHEMGIYACIHNIYISIYLCIFAIRSKSTTKGLLFSTGNTCTVKQVQDGSNEYTCFISTKC